jgi:hypothetical protein
MIVTHIVRIATILPDILSRIMIVIQSYCKGLVCCVAVQMRRSESGKPESQAHATHPRAQPVNYAN